MSESTDPPPSSHRPWLWSIAVSGVFLATLFFLWLEKRDPPRTDAAIASQQDLDAFLSKHAPPGGPRTRIPTGVFVQSLKFVTATDVQVTGYIWQIYPPDGPDIETGFILPDQVDALVAKMEAREPTTRSDGTTLQTWYFESTLRQSFEYADYPFDHKTIWIRFWSKDWGASSVLVPHIEGYDDLDAGTTFGLEESIVLGPWSATETFFDYDISDYDTNFGWESDTREWPELRFNIVVRRRSFAALIVNMLPLFVVASLVFGALMTLTSDPDRRALHGFSTSSIIGAASALFFVVVLAHIRLREQFAGARTIYLEYFYFLMYLVLAGVVVNSYLFATGSGRWLRFVHANDNLLVKTLYWPTLLGGMILTTLIAL